MSEGIPTNGQGKRFTCDLCVFWQTKLPEHDIGDCRLRLPTTHRQEAPWPRTEATDWCAQGRVDYEHWERLQRALKEPESTTLVGKLHR